MNLLQLFDSAGAVSVTDRDGTFHFKNSEFKALFPDFPVSSSIDGFLKEAFIPRDADNILGMYKALCVENNYFEFVGCLKTNKTRKILAKGNYDNQKDLIIWNWMIIPNTWRIPERGIEEEQNPYSTFLQYVQLEDIFNTSSAGNILLDQENTILCYGKSFVEKFLQNKIPDKTPSFLKLVEKGDQEIILKKTATILNGENQSVIMEFRLADGMDVMAYATRFNYDCPQTGEPKTGIFLQIYDNTEQKIKHKRLAHSQKTQAMGQLAGGIAHDFNNLLTAMLGFCDLLLMRHSPGDQSFNDIMQIKQNANRAANLVRQLLAFSRQQALQPRVLNIPDTLRDLSVLLQRLIGASIQLEIITGHNEALVKVDVGQFEQVIINLVVNARDAIEGEGKIQIRTSSRQFQTPVYIGHESIKPGSYIMIEVEDNGSGIDPKNIPSIFDPFFSTKAVGSGTGLGLSTVQGIINQTGGHIAVESMVGKGTRFMIYLPRHQCIHELPGNQNRKESLSSGHDLSGSGTILLVEDEDAVRLFSARALKDKGYLVIEASTGEEGFNFLRTMHERGEKTIDLMITDVVMPGMDGPTLVRKAHEFFPDLKVIFMSGYAEDSFRQKLNEGIVHFLPKPFNLNDLAEKTKQTLNTEKIKSPIPSYPKTEFIPGVGGIEN